MQATNILPYRTASRPHRRHARRAAGAGVLALAALVLPGLAQAASSSGCEGGGFTVSFTGGAPALSGEVTNTVAAGNVGPTLQVRGKYVSFDIDAASFGIRNYTLTGALNALDLTGGVPTVVFAVKQPDHRGLVLSGDVVAELDAPDMVISRTGTGLSMKIQAKDCATGGIFQMEPERADETRTEITHVLADGVHYFDNQNFRNREGQVLPYKDTTVEVTNRINFGNERSPRFVGRDSPQVADRVPANACVNVLPNNALSAATQGPVDTVLHCGGVSVWSVASGGRMGQVMGEDAVEVAPPATTCTHKCQARNRVRGQAVTLGFPFPLRNVLQPRFPQQ